MKKLLILMLIISFSQINIHAQDYKKIDSLKIALNNLPALNGTEADTLRMITSLEIGNLFQNQLPDSAKYWYESIIDTVSTHVKIKQNPRRSFYNATSLNLICKVLFNRSDYSNAKIYLEKSLQIRELIFDKYGIAASYMNRANIFMVERNILKSIEYYEKSLNISQEIGDKMNISICFVNLSFIYKVQRNYTKAKEYIEKSIKINEELKNKEGISTCLLNLGNVYKAENDYPKAIEYYEKSLKIVQELDNKSGMAKCYNNLGIMFHYQSDYSKAIEYYEKSLKINEELGDKSRISSGLNNLGMVFEDLGDYLKATEYYLKSLKINEEILDSNGIGICLLSVGNMMKNQGNYYKSIEYLSKALKLFESLNDIKGIAASYNNLGIVFENQGDFPKAFEYYEKALTINKEIGEKGGISICLNNLGNVFDSQGDYEKAIIYFEKSIKLKEEIEDKNGIANVGLNLAIVFKNKNEYSQAVKYLENSLKIKEETGDKNGISLCLKNLASVFDPQGNSSKAIQYLEKSLKIDEELDDKNGISICFNNLGLAYYNQQNYIKAIEYFKKSNKICEEIGMFSELANNYPNLALVYAKQQKYYEAIPLYLNAVRMKRKLIEDNFGTLSEKEKGFFLEKTGNVFNTFNEFASISKIDSVIAQCYNNILLIKGLLLQSNRGLVDAISKSADTNLTNTYWRFKKLRTDIADLYSMPINERGVNLDSLENIANTEERKLVLLSRDYNMIKKQFNNKWVDVKTALKKDDAAIEFVKINCEILLNDLPVQMDTIKNFKGIRDSLVFKKEKKDSTFYAAFIVRPGYKNPKMISLFDEKNLVAILNKMTNNRGVQVLDQPVTKEKSRELYDLIWLPMEKELNGVKTIYYSPDGLLNKVSFAALSSSENKFLFDIYNLKTLSSTRDLISVNKSLYVKPDFTCSIYGGIQYNLAAEKLINNAKKYKPENNNEMALNEKTENKDIRRGGEWNPLSGTLVEAEKIQKEFQKEKISPNLFTGENANEESFKSLSSKSPDIIHIATHGFYFSGDLSNNKITEEGNNFKTNKNPLFRSGLIMAGANRAWLGDSPIDGVDDGILTAFEVSNLDLSNTKLVVLSACETGLGDIKGSEGVYGLQRAFKMAGVQYLIVTLWEIRDEVTVEFMNTFYEQWLKGKEIHDAFKLAQVEMRKKYEANFWAAFVLVD
jgi:tetratricopeptide (TPR) repeat protein